ncbi:endonuclease/exonuclease/phosphatase family protein [Streptomyces sp. NPDC096176]|uniref:endonuclease/exonuclease/phosphatase family protein n=1 Tax=Streptomyces sp. NPDC096176 TaxID=3366079 RepID=UPI0038231A0C
MDTSGRSRFERGRVVAALAALVAFQLALHSAVPNTVGRLGSLLETFLPWLGLAVPVLLVAALRRRSVTALIAVLLPAAAWLGLFGALLLPPSDGPGDLVVVQHNVNDVNTDPVGTAGALARVSPDLVALEELTPSALPAYRKALEADLPHHAVVGTVGLWSRHPLKDVRPLDIRPRGIGPGWNRGLRATVVTPGATVAVHVAHLPSVRLGLRHGFSSDRRDESARLLAAALAAEKQDRVILLGDLNSTVDDRGLDPLRAQVDVAAPGFAFSWPASFPVARIDQIMTRSASVTHLRSLPPTGSDHLPIVARIAL